MKLRKVLNGLEFKAPAPVEDVEILGLACDSRKASKGGMFVAARGYTENGLKYIKDAMACGAKVILAEEDFSAPIGILKILVKDTRSALPILAGNYFDHPSQNMKMIGVTGTNGKTTITYIIESILRASGEGTGVIGTVNYRFKDKVIPAKNTTPGPVELQSMLASMRDSGLNYAVMEVSSHALDQTRIEGIKFDAAIFTNITNEHLDYHKTIDGYFKAKIKIFDKLKKSGSAVLNLDDDRVGSIKSSIKHGVITYGINKKADVTAKDIKTSLSGSKFIAVTPKGDIDIKTHLIGMHNVSNILGSIAAAIAVGIDAKNIKKGIADLECVPGRLEPVEAGQKYKIFVDYAHTEDALNNVLSLLREVAKKSIVTVFGCGGNRDRQKRPLMGQAACKYSDRVIITSDNPRFEDPDKIIEEIEHGIKSVFSNYEIISDRRKAIARALGSASSGDIVIIAGKGHEDYQIVGDKVLPFDDRKIARGILQDLHENKKNS